MYYAVFGVLAAALLVLDQWLKVWITANLPLGESMPFLPGFVDLLTVHNYGAAWSSFSGQRVMLLAVTAVIIGAVLFVLARRIVSSMWRTSAWSAARFSARSTTCGSTRSTTQSRKKRSKRWGF